ncbi:MAG: MFS transporter [Liquorilactobacillus hordei]|uniref:MFS transporter n=1 Tax=Liquorilactobacillus hordei TaxID=468911 RepID=UPI0039EA8DD5
MEESIQLKNKLAIISAALLAAGGIMIETAMNVTFPVLKNVFNTSLNNIQWVTTTYLLAVTVTMTISSYLTKKYGVRKIWLSANLIFIIGTLVAGLSPSLSVLLAGRVLEGISAGLAMPLMFNLILTQIPQSKIGVWMGIGAMVVSLAPSFGPTYGGIFIESLGWRAIFFTLLIIPVASLMMGWSSVREKRWSKNLETFDFWAFILLSVALISGILMINQLEGGSINIALLAITIVAFLAFIVVSIRSKKIFLNIRLFSSKSFTLLLIPVTLYMFANLGLGLLLPNYLESVAHTTSFLAGFSLLPGTLIGAVLSPVFGSLYDKIGSTKLLFIGNGIFAVILLCMALITHEMNFVTITLSYIVFTIGRSMAFSTSMTASVDGIPVSLQSDANAILQGTQMFMGAVGTTVAALFGSDQRGIEAGLQNFFWVLFVISILIFIMFVFRNEKNKKSEV